MNRNVNILLIITFSLILATPLVVQILGVEKVLLKGENIELESPPIIELENPKESIREIKHFYTTNFGLKSSLFEVYKNFIQEQFNEDPIPNKVIKGSKGWLFLGDSDSKALSESMGFINFSKKELKQITIKVNNQRTWLEKRGIKYYISIAPSKHTIYKEYLPFNPTIGLTKVKSLKLNLEKEINFELIDLKEYIVLKKDSVNLFYKHDTHWNDYGAFLGYKKLIDFIQKDFPILKNQRLKESDIVKVKTPEYILGDLNRLLNNNLKKEERFYFKKKDQSFVIKSKNEFEYYPYIFKRSGLYEKYTNKTKKLKILIFRDSFSTALRKFINETFGESVYIWNYSFDKELIEKEKPDIVLFELGERMIEKLNNQEE